MFKSMMRSYATVVPAAPAAPTPVVAVPVKPTPVVQNIAPVVKKVKRVGGIRGGLVGFLLGVTVTGAASYYYLLDEYKNANNVIISDIVALQSSIKNLEKHVNSLDSK